MTTKQWDRFENTVRTHGYGKFLPTQGFNYSVNISLTHHFVYFETPKVACSSIKSTLQRLELGQPTLTWDEEDGMHDRDFSPLLRPSQLPGFDRFMSNGNVYVFCFVRNPYSRLLSTYLDKIVRSKRPKRSVVRWLGHSSPNLNVNVSFQEFVEFVCSQEPIDMNGHWRPQTYQTCQHCVNFDFVGRFESFRTDFETVLSHITSDYSKYWHTECRHSTNSESRLTEYYTSSIRNRVFEKYRVDFEAFGYKRDSCEAE